MKELRQKKETGNILQKEEIESLNQEIIFLTKELKVAKDELRLSSKKYVELEE